MAIPPDQFSKTLESIKKQEGFETLTMIDSAGRILNEPEKPLESILGPRVYQKLIGQTADEGGFESLDKAGEGVLVSFLKIKDKLPMTMILTASTIGSHRAALLFMLKAGCTFLALISLSIILSIVFSNKLTSGVANLSEAMIRFGKGDLDVAVPVTQTHDEVADMVSVFARMKSQIKNLILELEDKARLEAEFLLAGDVQRRFMPADSFSSQALEFQGYYEPAKFAGGDWWYYFSTEDKFVFLIGDVTGHGINSAMMTGVARSAISLIAADYKNTSVALSQLNKVFCECSLGQLNMTCFIGALDLRTGELEYSNASHEFPFILPAKELDLRKTDFIIVSDAVGPRLGQDIHSGYVSSKLRVNPNEFLFVYSDGLVELDGESKDSTFGERNLLKTLGQQHKFSMSAHDLVSKVSDRVTEYRHSKDLQDDLSFFAIKWKGKI
jgi:sigma-B regulation protein RsbU (phosphoserine phosphatase)